jgi:aminoglycoside phosphotransferase family enzyme/predicted kinase
MTIVSGLDAHPGVGWIQANESAGGIMTALWRDGPTPVSLASVAPYADVKETHSAVVFLVGDRAFKLKKPVDLGFLDFSSPTKRLRACQRELELNRRLTPDVYLGISDLNDIDGKPLEHLLVMRRMPAGRRLAHLIRTEASPDDGLDAELVDGLHDLAAVVADFHVRAARGVAIDACGDREAVSDRWEANFTEVRPYVGTLLDADAYADVCRLARRYLAGRDAVFADRVRQGAVIDGHGDLLAEDIFLLPDGPRILDCLDFDDRLRFLDRIDDVACLVMDLEHLGSADAGQAFLDAYLRASGDQPPGSLVHHYIAYRAFMRAKVACLPGAADHGRSPATTLLDLARRHLDDARVRLLLVGGPPGTGKTTASEALSRTLGAVLLSSDPVRKELAGVGTETSLPAAYGAGFYSAEWNERTYDELLKRAGHHLELGRSVVLDASWADAGHRAAAARVAERTTSDLGQFRCVLDDATADRRILGRTSASDADPVIAAEVRAHFADWPEAVPIDTSGSVDAAVGQLLHRLQPWRTAARIARPHMLPD